MSNLAKNSFLYLIATLVLKGSSFFLLPFYTRLVSPEEYGIVYLITTLGAFLSLFLSLSVRGAVGRFYYDNKEHQALKEMFSSITIFIFIFTTIIYSILLFFSNSLAIFMNIDNAIYLKLGLMSSYFTVFFPIILALLYVQEKGKMVSIITIFTGLFSILTQLIFVINLNDKILAFMISHLINGFLQFILFLFFSKKYFIFYLNFKKLKEYLSYSLHSLPGDISVWIITFADRIMISKYKGNIDTGIYSIGYKLGQAPEMLFHSINKAYVPYIFNKYSNWNADNEKSIIRVTTYLFALFTGCIFILSIFSKEFILVLAEDYRDSLWIIVLILFSYLLSGYKLLFHNPMSFNKKYVKYKSGVWIFAAVLNIGLNFWLIPKYSMYGAAIATLISYIVTLIPILILSNRALKINYPIRKYLLIISVSLIYFMNIIFEVSLYSFFLKIIFTILYLWILIKMSNFQLLYYANKIKNKIKRRS